MDKSKAIKLLGDCLRDLGGGGFASTSDAGFIRWRRNTRIVLEMVFGKESSHLGEFENINYMPLIWDVDSGESDEYSAFICGINAARAILESMVEEVERYWEDQKEVRLEASNSVMVDQKRVFIVHGHNGEYRESAARLMRELGLEPIILHERPNKGRTIIEKFTDYADVSYAVVLLTADDLGGLNRESLKPRARQNVMFELGFFIGRLGRDRVVALYEEGVEIPSDYQGVLFVLLDAAGAWRYQVARELKAVGFSIDTNKIS